MYATRARLLLATLWVGSLWTIGYIVAPTLFASLGNSRLAGSIAGKLFRVEAWLSLACGAALYVLIRCSSADITPAARRQLGWLVVGMLACSLVGYFGLQPFMASLRETTGPDGAMEAVSRARFGVLHAVASALYLTQSLLGVALILKVR